jgi:hypothetical protein
MAAIVLVLAVADAALLANVALADTSASSVSVFAQAITGYTQGELLLLAAGLACCCRCCRGLPGVPPAHGAPSVEGCGWHDARWRVGSPSWRGRTHACVRSWRARGAPARWSGRAGRPARPRSKPATLPQRARGPAPTPPSGQGTRGRELTVRRAFGRRSHPARARQADHPGSTVGTRCGSGWAVPVGVMGWSEPGNQGKGGDGW